MEEFARQLEAQTHYRVFFDSVAVRGAAVTGQAQGQPLSSALRQLLAPAGLQAAVDEEHNIFIFRGPAPDLALRADFFRPDAVATGAAQPLPPPRARDTLAATRPASAPVVRATSPVQVYTIGPPASGAGRATLAGTVREAKSGEPVLGASIYIESPAIGVATDQYGYYALTLPVGAHVLHIRGRAEEYAATHRAERQWQARCERGGGHPAAQGSAGGSREGQERNRDADGRGKARHPHHEAGAHGIRRSRYSAGRDDAAGREDERRGQHRHQRARRQHRPKPDSVQ
ncbi:MAG: carboxypeptidase-like regulatory domain-containing protein [Hymenobacter sp.]